MHVHLLNICGAFAAAFHQHLDMQDSNGSRSVSARLASDMKLDLISCRSSSRIRFTPQHFQLNGDGAGNVFVLVLVLVLVFVFPLSNYLNHMQWKRERNSERAGEHINVFMNT